ncbi:MAG: hypothetical protein VX574_08740 [Myxococcota bacterium]|nr:hypothetical protein [Myxococcota bacterium]
MIARGKRLRVRAGGVLAGLGACVAMACATPTAPPPESPELDRLESLAAIFYTRVSNRRFNSISTFHDPALREFFHSSEAFADYYADLADALALASFEYNRPESVVVEEFEPDGVGRVQVRVRFQGENNKPLRFWSTSLVRVDQWELADGRWWIIPGKL